MPLQLGGQVLSFQAAGEESKGMWIIPWAVLIFDMAESDMKHTFPTHVQHRHLMQREGTPWEAVCLLRGRGHWCQIISSLAHSRGSISKVQKNSLAKSSCSVYPFLCLYVYMFVCVDIYVYVCVCAGQRTASGVIFQNPKHLGIWGRVSHIVWGSLHMLD